MIVEKQKESKVLKDGTSQGSIGMSLDLDSAQILMQMLSKNLYSDPIGSTVRECASNALDSHRRAGVNKPIIVGFSINSSGNYEFTVEDFGMGLDAKDVEGIISKYGKSTKRESNTELGMMGLGFKAPLAYSSSFYFVCRKDGIERKYMMYEGEDVNTIDLLNEMPTSEGNGVKIIVPVSYNDRWSFVEKIKEQLSYFESVYFDINAPNRDMISNDFKIMRSKHFQYSELTTDSDLHICLDNVYYPIDFAKLGIKRIYLKMGLRFGLSDGIFPTPNRESIRYTEDAKAKILDKIKELANHMMNVYNESIDSGDSVQNLIDHYSTASRIVTIDSETFTIDELITHSTVKMKSPTLSILKHLTAHDVYMMRTFILGEYRIKYKLHRNTLTSKINTDRIYSPNLSDHYYIFDERIKMMKKNYLKNILDDTRQYMFIKKTRKYPLFPEYNGDQFNYFSILDLHTKPKSEWRQLIKEFQEVVKLTLKNIKSIDDIKVPQSFKDSLKKQRASSYTGTSRRKAKGEFNAKVGESLLKWSDDRDCKFVPTIFKLEEFHKKGKLFIYDLHEEAEKLDGLFKLSTNQKIEIMTVSKRERKIIESFDMDNITSYKKFMKGDNKPFRRIVTAFVIDQLLQEQKNVVRHMNILSKLSTPLHDKLSELIKYRNNNYHAGNNKTYEAMLKVAEGNDLFDHNIHYIYKEVKETLESLKFMNVLFSRLNKYTPEADELIHICVEMCKRNGFRLNYQNYLPQIEEEEESEGGPF